ncbi:MAG: putative Ig domain-containing protein [Bryobacterales bacterium]|nr:putative Ig domain-containing protein [Bryobacterales bacterium]
MRHGCIPGLVVSIALGIAAPSLAQAQSISFVSPDRAVAGSGPVPITLFGNGFTSCTKVRFNGADLASTAGTGTLAATVPSSFLTTPGVFPVGAFYYQQSVVGNQIICSTSGTPSTNTVNFTVVPVLNITTTSPLPTATVNQSYQFSLGAIGGQAGYVWSLTAGTPPPGLTFSSTGILSGTPTATGTFPISVQVLDCDGGTFDGPCITQTARGQFFLRVSTDIVITSSSPLPNGVVGQSYPPFTFEATGGNPPYAWSFGQGSATLPGLSLSPGGVLSGTPTAGGTFNFVVNATDCGGSLQQTCNPRTRPKTFSITITSGPTITTSSPLPSGTAGQAYLPVTLAAVGGTQPYTWSILVGQLPAGLALNPATGVISGTPTTPGTSNFTAQVTDARQQSGARPFSITIGGSPLQILTTSLNSASVGGSYSQQLTAGGGAQPYSWSIPVGQLPAGLILNSSTGLISGTPTTAGTFNFTAQVTDSLQGTASRTFSIQVVASNALQILTASLSGGTVGVPYSQQVQATGGAPPYSWSVSVGALPPGLSIATVNNFGVISGTPTAAGTFNFTIQVFDSQEHSASRNFTIAIGSTSLQIITPSLATGSVGTFYSQAISATGGVQPLTWSVTAGQPPPGLTLNPSSGVLSGTPQLPGTNTFTVQVADSQEHTASRSFTVQITSGITIQTTSLPQGRAGQFYQQLLIATGGSGTLTWSPLTALPPGLTLNSATGVLSGTPTQAADFTLLIQVQDATGATASRTLLLSITASLIINTESPLPSATVGAAYNVAFSASGGITPFRWAALTPPPAGLTFDTLGNLTGTPTQAGAVTFTAQVTDAVGTTVAKDFTITIGQGFQITTPGLPNGAVGRLYNQTLSSTGGRAPITWGLDSSGGPLPTGLLLNPTTGILNGTPTAAGDFTFTIFALDADQRRVTKTFTMSITGQFQITTTTLPSGVVGTAYSQTLTTTGGLGTVTWSQPSGTLPTSLQLNTSTGAISGTPSEAGGFTFTIQAADSGNQKAQQSYTIVIIAPLSITTTSLPNGTLNVGYNASLAATGGEAPYTWTQTGLPDGLTLDAASGAISGTPTRADNFTVTVTVTDKANRTATRSYAIRISSGLSVTTSSLPPGTVGVAYSQTLQASGGAAGRTWSATGNLPPGLTLAGATGIISGTPSQAGSFSFTARVQDNQGNTATAPLSITVAALPVSGISISTVGINAGPGDQPGIAIKLTDPAPADLTGALTVAFKSDAGITDPALKFSLGEHPRFVIPRGQTNATFPDAAAGLNLALGTVAGTITITLNLNAGGVDVTPTPAPTQTIVIPKAAPVISTMTLSRNGNTLTIDITGFATPREVTSAEIAFTPKAGTTVQTTNFTVPVTSQFNTYYGNASNDQFGGTFRLTIPFTVTPDATAISGVSVTLVNSAGRSQPRSGTFP